MTAPFRVLVTGSRSWLGVHKIAGQLDLIPWRSDASGRLVVVVHGDCPTGADRIARDWAERRNADGWRVEHEPHPADWNSLGRGAGFARNAAMVRTNADVVLAFARRCELPGPCRYDGRLLPPGHFTHGTHDCVTRALGAGLELHLYRENSA